MDPIIIFFFFAFLFSYTNTNKCKMNSRVVVTWGHDSQWIEYNSRYLYTEANTAMMYQETRIVIKFFSHYTNCYCNTMYPYIADYIFHNPANLTLLRNAKYYKYCECNLTLSSFRTLCKNSLNMAQYCRNMFE
jgi:hypothetical protein